MQISFYSEFEFRSGYKLFELNGGKCKHKERKILAFFIAIDSLKGFSSGPTYPDFYRPKVLPAKLLNKQSEG